MSLPGNSESSFMNALSSDSYSFGTVSVISEYRHTACTDPIFSAVMFAVLLFKSFPKHFLYSFIVKLHVFSCGFFIVVSGRFFRLVKPIHQLFGNIVKKIYIFKKLQKSAVKLVKIRLTFYKHRTAQIIKACKSRIRQSLIQCLVKREPFVQ